MGASAFSPRVISALVLLRQQTSCSAKITHFPLLKHDVPTNIASRGYLYMANCCAFWGRTPILAKCCQAAIIHRNEKKPYFGNRVRQCVADCVNNWHLQIRFRNFPRKPWGRLLSAQPFFSRDASIFFEKCYIFITFGPNFYMWDILVRGICNSGIFSYGIFVLKGYFGAVSYTQGIFLWDIISWDQKSSWRPSLFVVHRVSNAFPLCCACRSDGVIGS